jgi:hypothetical protein
MADIIYLFTDKENNKSIEEARRILLKAKKYKQKYIPEFIRRKAIGGD